MKRKFFHGTSFDNLKDILANGLRPDTDEKVWTVSDRGVYLWSVSALIEAGECEESFADEHAKQRAYESAQMAMTFAKSGKCVVFEIVLDDEKVSEDTSCENMTGAVVCYENVLPSEIVAVWVSPDLSMLKGYFIATARRLEMFAQTFSDLENKIADAFDKAELYIESDEFPLERKKIKKSSTK